MAEVTQLPPPEPEPDPQVEPICFMLADGKTEVVVPCPLTAETWWWIQSNCELDLDPNLPAGDTKNVEAMLAGIVIKAERILSIATGIRETDFKDAPGLEAAICRLMVQIRGEWLDAAPFTRRNLLRGLELHRRQGILYGRFVLVAGSPPSPSKPKSAVGRGRKRAR
jgi:hypothetical protein